MDRVQSQSWNFCQQKSRLWVLCKTSKRKQISVIIVFWTYVLLWIVKGGKLPPFFRYCDQDFSHICHLEKTARIHNRFSISTIELWILRCPRLVEVIACLGKCYLIPWISKIPYRIPFLWYTLIVIDLRSMSFLVKQIDQICLQLCLQNWTNFFAITTINFVTEESIQHMLFFYFSPIVWSVLVNDLFNFFISLSRNWNFVK